MNISTRIPLAILLAWTMMISVFSWTSLFATSMSSTTNPYSYSFSDSNRTTLTTWINTKISTRKDTMSTTAYLNFVNTVITKINSMKSVTTNTKKMAVLNYLGYELANIVSQIEDDSLFLDDIDLWDTATGSTNTGNSTIIPTSYLAITPSSASVNEQVAISWDGTNNPSYFEYSINWGAFVRTVWPSPLRATPTELWFLAGNTYRIGLRSCNSSGCSALVYKDIVIKSSTVVVGPTVGTATSWGIDNEYVSTLTLAQTKAMYNRILELMKNPPENLVWERSPDIGLYATYREDIIGSVARSDSTNGVRIYIEYRKWSDITVGGVYIQEARSSKDLIQKWRTWIPKGINIQSYQLQPARFETTAFAWNKRPVYTKNSSTAELNVPFFNDTTSMYNWSTYHGFQCFTSTSCGSASDNAALIYWPDSGIDFRLTGIGNAIPSSGWLYKDRISDSRVVNLGKWPGWIPDQTGPTLGVQNRSSITVMHISKDNLVNGTVLGVVQNIINELNSMN